MIAFEPETLGDLKARYPAAIAEPFAIDPATAEVVGGRPGELRRCVFDCLDGLRLIISAEVIAGQPPYLHMSASIVPGWGIEGRIEARELRLPGFLDLCLERFRAISGDDGPLELEHVSEKGVPHWFRVGPGALP